MYSGEDYRKRNCFYPCRWRSSKFNLTFGETIKVDNRCSVAWDESVFCDISYIGSIKSTLFGGEGLFLNTLTGPGTVILQTMSLSKLGR
ncbi:MAG: hypothetical protein DRG80_07425 [Deltaproteobacteria bacterium]|nr:MAG: hypothetical protein DRG80_07425 [Deltaproteobacteria bacterium]